MSLKNHWENIYASKTENQMSWYEEYPAVSMKYFEEKNLPKDAAIIDVGGGQSRFAEILIDKGFTNVSVLDISASAIENNKKRIGNKAKKIKWIVSDINSFNPGEKYSFWHDRAVLHFLITDEQVKDYLHRADLFINESGYLTLGTFSDKGPEKCSGLEIRQYTEDTMTNLFGSAFEKIYCEEVNHITPSKKEQNFVFCNFRHK